MKLLRAIDPYERKTRCNGRCSHSAQWKIYGITQGIKLCDECASDLVRELCNAMDAFRHIAKETIKAVEASEAKQGGAI